MIASTTNMEITIFFNNYHSQISDNLQFVDHIGNQKLFLTVKMEWKASHYREGRGMISFKYGIDLVVSIMKKRELVRCVPCLISHVCTAGQSQHEVWMLDFCLRKLQKLSDIASPIQHPKCVEGGGFNKHLWWRIQAA